MVVWCISLGMRGNDFVLLHVHVYEGTWRSLLMKQVKKSGKIKNDTDTPTIGLAVSPLYKLGDHQPSTICCKPGKSGTCSH